MKTLITPEQVITIAFPGLLNNDTGFVSESVIVGAQQKFIKPVLNGLYEKIEQGAYTELLEEFIKPALAHYVRYLLLPSISVQVGTVGVIQPKGQNFNAASERSVTAIRKRTRADATALMRRTIEHIEASQGDYPEYDPTRNVLNRISTDANIIL